MERSGRTRSRTVHLIFFVCAFLGLAPAAATYGAGPSSQPPVIDAPFLGLAPAGATYGAGPSSQPPAEPPALDVQRDKEKTVYTIGTRPRDTRRDDTDRSWDMLNNMAIDARGTHGKGPNNNR